MLLIAPHYTPGCATLTIHPMADGYDKRQDDEGRWEVYDTGNDRVVTIDGLPLSGMDEDEANEAIERLNARQISPDSSPETP